MSGRSRANPWWSHSDNFGRRCAEFANRRWERAMGEAKVKDYKIAMGGLMRCCVATLDERCDEPVPEGGAIPCRWCSSRVVLKDGVWQWDRPSDPSPPLRPRTSNEPEK